jgi:type IX secretion system PorP/SprF family membrane protein
MKKIFSAILLIIAATAFGQDIHFSQYNASPLNLNPALTGFFNGDYRLAVNYRSQWGSFTRNYRTISGSFEFALFKGKLKYDNFAIGLLMYNDVAGDSRYGSNNMTLSVGYRKQLGYHVKHNLSFGLQAAVLQQRISFNNLQFDNQFNGIEFDETIPPSEILNKTSGFKPDVSVGLLWQVIPNDAFNYYFGGSYYHVLRPSTSLFDGSQYKLPSRYVAHAGAYVYVSNSVNLLPSAAFYKQAGTWQVNAGTYVQFVLDDWNDAQTAFAIGLWARVAEPVFDAVVAGFRLDFQNILLGFSYDFNVSALKRASNVRGAYELSLIYTGGFSSKAKRRYYMPCPQL